MRRARVLIVDDEIASRAVIASALDGLGLDVMECASADEALAAVADPPDAIVLDLMMPGIDGIELCRRLRSAAATRDVPILMLTAHTGREQKLSALEAGVDDFLSKPLDRLELRTRIAAICRLNRYRRVLEERQRLDSLVSLSPNGVLVVESTSGCVRFANARAEEMFGAALDGRTLGDMLGPDATDTVASHFARSRTLHAAAAPMEPWTLSHGAHDYTVAGGIVDWMGEPAMQLVITDITALRRFEEEVHRLERMETTARLSASVAHDFATVLQICLVHLRTLSGPAARDASQAAISEMHAAIRRGTQITRDLLSFSRRGLEQPGGACDAAVVVTDLSRMLDALLPRTMTLVLTVSETPCRVGIADYQLEQVLVNLATNARDAMEGKGVLTMSVLPGSEAPDWTEVTVRDTGGGIEPRVQARLGEPFVSTKEDGQGTGLGLWSVIRMVEGAGGRCVFDSVPGTGTTVRLHLPPPPAAEVAALRAV